MYWVMGRKSLHANLQKIRKVNKLLLRSLIDSLPFDITSVANMVSMLNYFEVSSNELEWDLWYHIEHNLKYLAKSYHARYVKSSFI